LIAILSFLTAAAGRATPAPALATPAAIPTALPLQQPITFQQVSWGAQHPAVLYLVEILFIIAIVGLIALMSVQTTKNEGLSGTIGGRTESTYRGRLGFDQQLTRLTGVFAISFIVLAILNVFITR
jgi:protein translocase SecG subunit